MDEKKKTETVGKQLSKDHGDRAKSNQPEVAPAAVEVSSDNHSSATGLLSDPLYSGIGTWLGTLLSILAAIAAYKQARKADSAVKKIEAEQNRQHIESARRHVDQLDQILKPILNTKPLRGTNVVQVLDNARHKCHEVLSLPLDDGLIKIPDSIKSIEGYLSKYIEAAEAASANPPNKAPLQDLQALIRNEIQFSVKSCTGFSDSFARNNK